MGAVSGRDLTFSTLGPAERIAILQQRVFCARAVIAFASDVAPHEHLPVLLAMLQSRTAALRQAAVKSVHVLSSSYSGALRSQISAAVFTVSTQKLMVFSHKPTWWFHTQHLVVLHDLCPASQQLCLQETEYKSC